jgi:polyisoprenoid-binding protein YceI
MKALLVLALIFSPALSQAAIPLKGNPDGSVNFLAVGKPSALKIHGKAAGPDAKLSLDGTKLTGSAEFDMNKLDTGIELRNQHMKEKYLQVQQHPKAKLTLTDVEVDPNFAATLSNSGEKPFKGKLQLHGQERDVEGTYTAKNGLVQAKFQIKLTNYGIEIPSYLGITVAELVDVNVDLPISKE